MATSELLWRQAEWLSSASAWITLQTDRLGFEQIAPIVQPHVRPWSTVLQIPTNQGNLYFKAGASNQVFEPRLLHFLHQRQPDFILPYWLVTTSWVGCCCPKAGQP